MDSAAHSHTATTDENSKIVMPSKRGLFLSTYQPHQPWSMADSIIYYISKNPSSSKVYEKLIQSCKYFFIKNPILVIPHLSRKYQKNDWKILFNRKDVDLNSINCKIWISDNIYCRYNNVNDQYFATSFLPKIFQCDAKKISLYNQSIFFKDLVFLASKCKDILLFTVAVLDENGSAVAVEKIVETFPLVKEWAFDVDTKAFTSKTAKNLIKIPHFQHLDIFNLLNIPECFDIDTFFSYIKKNKKTKIALKFCENISQQYRNRLQASVNEIIEAENRDYRPPYIRFPGMDESSLQKLLSFFCLE